MILCVTFNPAIDRTMVVRDFAQGGVFRPQHTIVAPGGKGINVARAARALGGDAICAGFLGGFSGRYLESSVALEGIASRWTWLSNRETRTCVILIDPDTGLTSVVNESGPTVDAADWIRFRDDVLEAAGGTGIVSFSGSVPPGTPLAQFERLVRDLIAAGKHVWVDTSGAALKTAASVRGVALKVNEDEATSLTWRPIDSISDAVSVAREIYTDTVQTVVITMGERGAILVDGGKAWHAVPPPVAVKSAVGSGDSFLAGLVLALANGESFGQALAQATAAGAANALSVGGGSFTRSEFDGVLGQIRLTSL